MSLQEKIEKNAGLMIVLTLLTVSFGGLLEIVPLFSKINHSTHRRFETLLYCFYGLAGRDIYIREGCYNCHSQMVRPFHARKLSVMVTIVAIRVCL